MKFTIIGNKGFIGKSIIEYLNQKKIDCFGIDLKSETIPKENLGHVIYAVGITSDFRERVLDTYDAHVCTLKNVIQKSKFDSFLYLSSTRIYSGGKNGQEETSFVVSPSSLSDSYNITKIAGESICMHVKKPNVRIARLSNVVGKNFMSNDFIFSIIRDAIKKKKIILQSSLESEKDYVDISDVLDNLVNISLKGKHSIYNVASGTNIKTSEIISKIKKVTDCQVIEKNKDKIVFPTISIERIKNDFKFYPRSVLEDIENLTHIYKNIS